MEKKTDNTVRLQDVAKKASVGVGTASRVLNNHPNVSEEKRKRVLEVMEEMGYRPNFVARSLKTKSTKTIGLILMDITNPFYADILRGIQDEVTKADYSLILTDLGTKGNHLPKAIETMGDKKLDGIIYIGNQVDDDSVQLFLDTRRPLVFVSTAVILVNKELHDDFFSIEIDNENGAYEGVMHLIHRGYKRIALISGVKGDQNSSVPRMKGYKNALEEKGLHINPQWIHHGEHSFKTGYEGMKGFLSLSKVPDAVFAISDMAAIGAMKAAFELGYRIPEDIGVIGFDGITHSAYTHPTLTTISQPRYEMGTKAIQLMLDQIEGRVQKGRRVLLDYRLVKGGSC